MFVLTGEGLVLAGECFGAELVVDEEAHADGEGDESGGGDGEDIVLVEDPGEGEGEGDEADAGEDAGDASGAYAVGDAEAGLRAGRAFGLRLGRQGQALGEIGHALLAAELVGVVQEELLDEHNGDHKGKGRPQNNEG